MGGLEKAEKGMRCQGTLCLGTDALNTMGVCEKLCGRSSSLCGAPREALRRVVYQFCSSSS